MERMTEHRGKRTIIVDIEKHHESTIRRLAAIEDILGDDYDLDRLRELVEADAEDRCVVLPRFESPAHADPVGSPGTPGPVGHNQELVEFAAVY